MKTQKKPFQPEELTLDSLVFDGKEIQLSPQKFHTIIDSGPVGIIIVNHLGHITYINTRGETMFGYERGELLGKELEVLMPQNDREMHVQFRHLYTRNPNPVAMGQGREFKGLCKDGSLIPIEVGLDFITENGETSLIGFVVDISERRKVEYALEESESRFRRLVYNSKDAIFEVNLRDNILYASPACKDIFGYEMEQFVQNPGFSLGILHPDCQQQYEDFWKQHEASGTFPEKPSQWAWIHKEGHTVYTENTFTNLYDSQENLIGFQTIARDITDRVLAQAALKESEERLRSTLESMDDLVFVLDKEGVFRDYHKPDHTFLILPPEKFLGRSFQEVLPEHLSQLLAAAIDRLTSTQTVQQIDYALEENGQVHWFRANVSMRQDNSNRFNGVTLVAREITALRDAELHLEHMATHDALTDLPNRTLMHDRLVHAMEQAKRTGKRVAVMFLDLDRFKNVNDTLGHAKGDLLLREVASRLSDCLRQSDTIGRLGGDEFVIVLDGISILKDVVTVAQKIMRSFAVPFRMNGQQFFITISVGISMYPEDGQDEQSLLKNADLAMYRAKEQGKNHYQFYDPEMNIQALERLILENSLRHALEKDEFVLYYQPKINTQTGRITGVEALLRWHHPEFGLLRPGQFLSLAEETGLIIPISEWVLRTACNQNLSWQSAGHAPMYISVNLSNRQFQVQGLAKMVVRVLDETGHSPSLLELEICEPTAIQNTEKALIELNALKKIGVRLSLDDFGTRYSSLNYLKRFPIDTIKIDQSFVYDIATNPDDAAIASAIIAMAHSLGLDVVAEGVETDKQLEFLRKRDCDHVQGHVFSQAMPAGELTAVLEKNRAELEEK